eukprot:scaffold24674_cov72-Skeletonema_dohrnii-CCMP3373.AAC.1
MEKERRNSMSPIGESGDISQFIPSKGWCKIMMRVMKICNESCNPSALLRDYASSCSCRKGFIYFVRKL